VFERLEGELPVAGGGLLERSVFGCCQRLRDEEASECWTVEEGQALGEEGADPGGVIDLSLVCVQIPNLTVVAECGP
jgi:hypothetical protein